MNAILARLVDCREGDMIPKQVTCFPQLLTGLPTIKKPK